MRIICIVGKSGSGKDSVINAVLKKTDKIKPLVLYTTRPKRPGEKDGSDYHFIDNAAFDVMDKDNKFIAKTEYNTIEGLWKYAIPIPAASPSDVFIMASTPSQIHQMKEKIRKRDLFVYLDVYYIECDEEMRIIKLFEREKKKEKAGMSTCCDEIIRRLKTDKEDFSHENRYMAECIGMGHMILNDYTMSPDEMADELLMEFGV